MEFVSIAISFLFFYQLWQTYTARKAYKNGGSVKSIYKHKSFTTRVMGVIIILTLSFTGLTYRSFGLVALANLPLIAYVCLAAYKNSRPIEILEKGLYINGRFILWDQIKEVSTGDRKSIRLSLNHQTYRILVMDGVEEVESLKKYIVKEIR